MKLIPVLLATTLFARGASNDPGKEAINFLEKVRLGKLDLTPGGDTALSPQTADEKKREIARRLERVARDLGSDPLELGAVKTDDDYAAVLVRKVGGFDPGRLQVFPVAMVKRGTEWSAAPLPASFENAGTGYAVALRKRLDLLENWMLREQVVDLEKLREQSAARMRQKIQAHLTTDELRSLDAGKIAQRFLTACASRDLPSVLGLLGGLSNTLPDDWPARLKSADAALSSGSPAKHPWRLLTSPDVLRVVVHQEEEETSGLFSVACLDPSTTDTRSEMPRIEIVHFELSKTHGNFWQIDPSSNFLQESNASEEQTDEDADIELLDAFPVIWRESNPAAPQGDANRLHQEINTALREGDLPSLLKFTQLECAASAARKACMLAAQVWWTLHDPAVVQYAMPLAFHENEGSAVGLYQFFSARDPDKTDLKALYFIKSASGWLWTPDPDAAARESLKDRIAPDIKRWSGNWQQSLLANSVELKDMPGNPAPTADEARKIVESWIQATRAGDVKGALLLTTRLSDPNGGATLLRNLGHEIISARRANSSSQISGIYQGDAWTGVGVAISQGGKTIYPLYPVVRTPDGLRILIEIDLFASRGREFLNKTALERLKKLGTPAAAADLRSVFAEFQKEIEKPKH